MEGRRPPELPERPEGAAAHGLPPFASPAGRARNVLVAFYVFLVVAVVTIGADVIGWFAVDAEVDGATDGGALLDVSDVADRVVSVAWTGVSLALVVLFLVWFHRVNANLPALGIDEPQMSPRWAVGCWFVPFVNLVFPKLAANDVWRSGDPDLPIHDRTWADRPVSPLLHVWWGAWIVSSVVDSVVAALMRSRLDEFGDYRSIYAFDVVSTVGNIVAALLAIAVIRRLTARQEARAAALRSSSPPPLWREVQQEFTREPAWAPSDSL